MQQANGAGKARAAPGADADGKFFLHGQTGILRGQAALDFLMTYGWALMLMALVVASLFALGIFDVGNFVGNRASGFVQVGVVGWRVSPAGAFTLLLKNNAGTDINITMINATLSQSNVVYSSPVINLANGAQSSTISVGTFSSVPSAGNSYTAKVLISYNDSATGFTYVDTGTLYGKIN